MPAAEAPAATAPAQSKADRLRIGLGKLAIERATEPRSRSPHHAQRMLRRYPLLKVDIGEQFPRPCIRAAHPCLPQSRRQRIIFVTACQETFSAACSHVRFQGAGRSFLLRRCGLRRSLVRTAGDRTRRRRLNKLSCAGWVPHDRGSVSGLPRSRVERRSGRPAHNRHEGSPPWSCLQQCAPRIVADLLFRWFSFGGRVR